MTRRTAASVLEMAKEMEWKALFLAMERYAARMPCPDTLAALKELVTHDPGSEYERRNKLILKELRSAIHHPRYQTQKHDETAPHVRFLHGLCMAAYIDTALVDVFEYLGDCLFSAGHHLAHLTGQRLALAKQGIPTSRGGVVFRGRARFFQELGLLTRLLTSKIPLYGRLHFLQPFFFRDDERGAYENNPGALYEERFTVQGRRVRSRTVYTPSPFVGVAIAPEFTAVLQAMENRHVAPLSDDLYPYSCWLYVNLQNITRGYESKKSVALMELERIYPRSFKAITLTQGSRFFLDQKSQLTEDYKEALFRELTHEDNFHLHKRTSRRGGGYFFPVAHSERTSWKEEMMHLVDRAYQVVQEEMRPDKEASSASAFLELVHLGIMKRYQAHVLRHSASQTRTSSRPCAFPALTEGGR